MINGQGSFLFHFGNIPCEHLVSVIDQHTKAQLKFIVPVAPIGWKQDRKKRSHNDDSGNDSHNDSEDSEEDEEEEDRLNEYEDDGFLVLEEEEEDSDGSYGNDSQRGDDECAVCGEATVECGDEVLICDGCSLETHMQCARLTHVPPGDWYCFTCNRQDTRQDTRAGVSSSMIDDDEEEEEEIVHSRKKKNKKERSQILSDSD